MIPMKINPIQRMMKTRDMCGVSDEDFPPEFFFGYLQIVVFKGWFLVSTSLT